MLNLSPTNESHLRSALRNLTATVLLLLACAVTASAYTLVFRDGRRLEIPSEFTLTRTTLTYESSPGFSKTMQLILIDVAATERANHEAPGSFFKHAEETPTVTQPAPQPAPQARRTLTNRDLAAVRQRAGLREAAVGIGSAYSRRNSQSPGSRECGFARAASGGIRSQGARGNLLARASSPVAYGNRDG